MSSVLHFTCTLHVGSNTRTGVKISPTTSSPVEKTAWLWSLMRTANGTTFPATTICPTSARREQVRKVMKRKKNDKRCSEKRDVWAYRERERVWKESFMRLQTFRKDTKRNDLAAPPHFSVTFEKSVETSGSFLRSFIVNWSIFKSSAHVTKSSRWVYLDAKYLFFFLPIQKLRKAGVLLGLLLPSAEGAGFILFSREHIRASFYPWFAYRSDSWPKARKRLYSEQKRKVHLIKPSNFTDLICTNYILDATQR